MLKAIIVGAAHRWSAARRHARLRAGAPRARSTRSSSRAHQVGINPTLPPLGNFNDKNEIVGFDVDYRQPKSPRCWAQARDRAGRLARPHSVRRSRQDRHRDGRDDVQPPNAPR